MAFLNKHLREHFIKTGNDGFVEASMVLVALFYSVLSSILYARSFWQAVSIFFLEIIFEAGAIPAGITVFGKEDDTSNTYIAKMITWEAVILLTITALLVVASMYSWPISRVCLLLLLGTVLAVAWEASSQQRG